MKSLNFRNNKKLKHDIGAADGSAQRMGRMATTSNLETGGALHILGRYPLVV
jgi:hypothetical protein